ncbi:MAG: hypothetical protein M3R34_05195, partial [Acidobacteriota bacterium]|nr:hypothetical protein [Acidobacteriota bacterium]
MRKVTRLWIRLFAAAAPAAALVLILTGAAPPKPAPQGRVPADLLVVGARLVLMDAEGSVVEDGALAVANGQILAAGRSADLKAR